MMEKPLIVRWISKVPCTLFLLVFSAFLMSLLAYSAWWLGDRDAYPNFLKAFLFPGMLPLYIVGTLANSAGAGWASFVVGMISFYGVLGLILDLVVHFTLRRKKPARTGGPATP